LGRKVEIRVPDIGDFEDVEVVEILVAKGDRVALEDPLVSVESDKATMEIPATIEGTVLELRVSEGDRVSEGSVLLLLDAEGAAEDEADGAEAADRGETGARETPRADDAAGASEGDATRASGAEAERAAEKDGEAEEGTDEASEAAVAEDTAAAEAAERDETTATRPPMGEAPDSMRRAELPLSAAAANPIPDRVGLTHASPLVRRFARELGVPISQPEGSGPHGRVLVDDLKRHVRERFARDTGSGAAGAGGALPEVPFVDPSTFGPVREEKLTRIQKVSGPNLLRSWLNVPHVTQHEDADVTALERLRRESAEAAGERGVKLSPLHFVMKAVVVALQEFPTFRSVLAPEGDRLLVKEYFHLGIAVDTDQGLVVPVIRDVDRKGVFELAAELAATSERARSRKLGAEDLRGACFTISSLGGIGGTAFTPIVNAPEVAVLGLSRTRVQPVWEGPSPAAPEAQNGEGGFVPRLVLPLSLSYDHRVIDGALAARFTARLARLLADPLQLLL
jgi:pyruvate dehydrogenase E2 component (dihydrolipoamide acetyltransferase)